MYLHSVIAQPIAAARIARAHGAAAERRSIASCRARRRLRAPAVVLAAITPPTGDLAVPPRR
jgi:hypothetical protein